MSDPIMAGALPDPDTVASFSPAPEDESSTLLNEDLCEDLDGFGHHLPVLIDPTDGTDDDDPGYRYVGNIEVRAINGSDYIVIHAAETAKDL